MIFAKKKLRTTINEGILTAHKYSFTKQVTTTVSIAGKYSSNQDKVFIIEDFLAKMAKLLKAWFNIEQAGETQQAITVSWLRNPSKMAVILEKAGYPVLYHLLLDRFENGQVVFKEADL